MDWSSVDFDWNRARAFLVTAEEGSFTAAARALGLTQPTLGRQVQALSDELGVVLFERVGRGLHLTPTGESLLQHVRAMGDAARKLSLCSTAQSRSLTGTVCISASEVHAVHLLPPILATVRAQHPGIELEVIADSRSSDLLRRQADIALRNYRPREPELVARKLRDAEAHLYASIDYLHALAHPGRPEDLQDAVFIGFDASDGLRLALQANMGLALRPEQFQLRSENQLVQWAWVKQGMGIGIMMKEVGDAEADVRRLWPSLAPVPFPMWLVAHREVHSSRRVRAVFDLLAAALGAPAPDVADDDASEE